MDAALTSEQIEALRALPIDTTPNRLVFAFALKGLAQKEACDALGWSGSRMSQIVNGKGAAATVVEATILSRLFGCPIEVLFPVAQPEALAS